jgi:hypothetical protein
MSPPNVAALCKFLHVVAPMILERLSQTDSSLGERQGTYRVQHAAIIAVDAEIQSRTNLDLSRCAAFYDVRK